jgi:SAM-dependent methyltransferase
MSTDWYQNFFTGLIADVQRRMPQQTDADLAFLKQALELKPGDRLLDVPCGTGRLSIPLAEQGFDVTGVDLSTELLRDARKPAEEKKKLKLHFEQRDMRDLPWENLFDGAFCFGNSFSYLGEDGNRDFLRAIHRVLKPGGRFALETRFAAECLFHQAIPKRWFPLGDLFFLHDTSFDPVTATQTSTYILIRGGEVEKKTAVYNVYLCRDLLKLFADVGFIGVESFGSLTREPFRVGSPGLWIVARKPS